MNFDEYRILFDKTSGEILLCRNNDTVSQPRILTFADPNQTFYPFLFLNGRITALSVFALIAQNVRLTETIIIQIQPIKQMIIMMMMILIVVQFVMMLKQLVYLYHVVI